MKPTQSVVHRFNYSGVLLFYASVISLMPTSCAHEEGGGDEGDGTVQHGGLDHLPALHQIAETTYCIVLIYRP